MPRIRHLITPPFPGGRRPAIRCSRRRWIGDGIGSLAQQDPPAGQVGQCQFSGEHYAQAVVIAPLCCLLQHRYLHRDPVSGRLLTWTRASCQDRASQPGHEPVAADSPSLYAARDAPEGPSPGPHRQPRGCVVKVRLSRDGAAISGKLFARVLAGGVWFVGQPSGGGGGGGRTAELEQYLGAAQECELAADQVPGHGVF
jgi:hypothetical protein